MSDQFEANSETFEQIYDAVSETARGRWFLSELLKRNRVSDTAEVLLGIESLKEVIERKTAEGYLDILRRELQQMSTSIKETRSEIAAIRPDEAANNRIMAATEELDAIVTSTERATSDILSTAEKLQEIAEKLRASEVTAAIGDEIESLATNIFMACSFQDITGQRTTKVVNTMRYLEQRVNAMIEIWGTQQSAENGEAGTSQDARPDGHLLNGPQSEEVAISQEDVDRMLETAGDDGEVEAFEQALNEGDNAETTPTEESAEHASLTSDMVEVGSEEEPISQDDIDALFG